MPAKKQDFTIEQGVDWSHGWLVTVDGEPIDDTWTAKAQVRSKYGPDLLHAFAADVTSEGAVVISAVSAESSLWKWVEGVYDVEVTNDDESITRRVSQGQIRVSREVTQ